MGEILKKQTGIISATLRSLSTSSAVFVLAGVPPTDFMAMEGVEGSRICQGEVR